MTFYSEIVDFHAVSFGKITADFFTFVIFL